MELEGPDDMGIWDGRGGMEIKIQVVSLYGRPALVIYFGLGRLAYVEPRIRFGESEQASAKWDTSHSAVITVHHELP